MMLVFKLLLFRKPLTYLKGIFHKKLKYNCLRYQRFNFHCASQQDYMKGKNLEKFQSGVGGRCVIKSSYDFKKNDEINFKIIKKNEAHNLIRILHLIKRFYLKWVLIQLLLLKAMTLSTDLPGFQGSLRYKHVERNIGTMMFS